MTDLLLLTTTVVAYLAGVALQDKTGSPLANPTLLGITLIGVLLHATHMSYATYFAAVQPLHFLLGPATVALAVPMMLSLEHLRRGLAATTMALVAGSVTGAVSGYALVRVCGGEKVLALSMLPKSLTTPIAMGVAQGTGGVASLTAVFAILSGILAAVALPLLMRVMKISDPAAIGLSAGTGGSGIAAASVIPLGPVPAAFAGVAIGVNGLLTALLAPLLVRLFSHW